MCEGGVIILNDYHPPWSSYGSLMKSWNVMRPFCHDKWYIITFVRMIGKNGFVFNISSSIVWIFIHKQFRSFLCLNATKLGHPTLVVLPFYKSYLRYSYILSSKWWIFMINHKLHLEFIIRIVAKLIKRQDYWNIVIVEILHILLICHFDRDVWKYNNNFYYHFGARSRNQVLYTKIDDSVRMTS